MQTLVREDWRAVVMRKLLEMIDNIMIGKIIMLVVFFLMRWTEWKERSWKKINSSRKVKMEYQTDS